MLRGKYAAFPSVLKKVLNEVFPREVSVGSKQCLGGWVAEGWKKKKLIRG